MNDSGYVPATEDVRAAYVNSLWMPEHGNAQFDRWLRQVKAEAWAEGAKAQADAYGMDVDTGPNPYLDGDNK